MSVNDGTGENWVETDPADTLPAGGGALELRDLRLGVRLRMKKEHDDLAGTTAGGEHKAGSGVIYNQALAPTLRPDGVTALDTNDKGRLWFKSTGELYIWSGSAWAQIESFIYSTGSVPTAALAEAAVTVAKLATQSKVQLQEYLGNGGSQTLTFSFAPTLVIILGTYGTTSIGFLQPSDIHLYIPFNGQQIAGGWVNAYQFTFIGDPLTNFTGVAYYALALG